MAGWLPNPIATQSALYARNRKSIVSPSPDTPQYASKSHWPDVQPLGDFAEPVKFLSIGAESNVCKGEDR
jgi:hypothetical protein